MKFDFDFPSETRFEHVQEARFKLHLKSELVKNKGSRGALPPMWWHALVASGLGGGLPAVVVVAFAGVYPPYCTSEVLIYVMCLIQFDSIPRVDQCKKTTYTYPCLLIHIYIHTYIQTDRQTWMRARTHSCMHERTHGYICMYTYIIAHGYINIHKHLHIVFSGLFCDISFVRTGRSQLKCSIK